MNEIANELTRRDSSHSFEWDDDSVDESLRELKAFATSRASRAIGYYQDVRRPKKWWAVRLRVIALICAGLSGILPLVSQIFTDSSGKPVVPPALASVFLALAAGAIAIDRYFGFSTAWMRFMASELRLSRALDQFELDWEATRAGINSQPAGTLTQAMMKQAKDFVSDVATIVGEETEQWVAEFRETIRQLDERTGRVTRGAAEDE
jgi:SMODS and SLOG-associating 2TM effector domain 2